MNGTGVSRGWQLACRWLVPSRYVLRRGDRRAGTVALTFDDGPTPDLTPRVLDALDQRGVKATFFLVGEEAARHPALTRDVVRRGHEVGNHTYSHQNLAALGPAAAREQVDRGRAVLEEVTGRPVRLLRPPWGAVNLAVLLHAAHMGLTVVLWSVDSRDWRRTGGEGIRRTLRQARVRPGDILLLHDDYPETVAALPGVLGDLRRSNLSLGRLADLGSGPGTAG